jgi:hypothetical protein
MPWAAWCLAAAGGLACAGGTIGDPWEWKRPCGTPAQRDADRQACLTEAAGFADPSDEADFAQDLFARCMERRGWRRVSSGTVVRCEQPDAP